MPDSKKDQAKGKESTSTKNRNETSGEQMKRSSQKEKSGVRAIGGA